MISIRNTFVKSQLRSVLSLTGYRSDRFTSNECGPPPAETDIVDFPDNETIQIPIYPFKKNEPMNIRKQRLLYQSRKRGMLENDLLLSTFAKKYLKTMTDEQVEQYDKLINVPSNDWDIYNWATNTKPTPIEYNHEIMDLLKRHVKNEHREFRNRMPDLDSDK